jgi:hypothetical protein
LPEPRVLIENPPPGGSNSTGLNRARRYVRQGRATFVGTGETVIRFGNYMRAVVARSASESSLAKLTGFHYDAVRDQLYEHARAIPVIQPAKLIETRGDEIAWSFSASVDHRLRRAHTAAEVAEMRKGMAK